MIFGQTKLELKVGFFVFIGLGILLAFVLLIGDFKTWTSGYKANFIFNFVNGVKIGAPIRFEGVDVGEVQDLHIILLPGEERSKVKIIGWLKEEAKIPVDSTVWINTLGLLGEKYIEIIPGKDYNNCLAKNETIVGKDPMPMHEVTELLKSIAGKIDDNIMEVKDTLASIRLLATDVDEAVIKIKKGEGTIGKLLYEDTVYKELEALMIDLRRHPWKLFWKGKEKTVK